MPELKLHPSKVRGWAVPSEISDENVRMLRTRQRDPHRMNEKKFATASGVKGRCKLCHNVTYLCDSHLLPAALYRLLRSSTVTPRDPLLITPGVTRTTSRQVSDYVLCPECEDKLRAGGEDWVLRHCYRGGETFGLRALALGSKLLNEGPNEGPMGNFYSAKSNPNISTAALSFFAASVIWKAAAHRWPYLAAAGISPLALGPYEERLRTYLLGRDSLPPSIAVWVWVSRYERPSRAISTPHSDRMWGCHVHSFAVPGMLFMLFAGRTIPYNVRYLCISRGPDRPILVSNAPDDLLATDVDNLSRTTKLSKALKDLGEWRWHL